jgi:hypothetical protein
MDNSAEKFLSSVENVGSSLLEDAESLAYGAVHAAEYSVDSASSYLSRGLGALEHGLEQGLDVLNQSTQPLYSKVLPQPAQESKRPMLRKLLNIVLALAVLVLIGVIIYLTCQRYSLVGSALSTGNTGLAAALLTPELSTGLSSLSGVF